MSASKTSRTLPSDPSLADVLAAIQRILAAGPPASGPLLRHPDVRQGSRQAPGGGPRQPRPAAAPDQGCQCRRDRAWPPALVQRFESGPNRPRSRLALRTPPGRDTAPLSPVWKDLYRHLNRTAWRIGLRDLPITAAPGMSIPSSVDDRNMADYLKNLVDHGLIEEPREVHRVSCVYWNQAVTAIPAWPKHLVKVPSYVQTYSLTGGRPSLLRSKRTRTPTSSGFPGSRPSRRPRLPPSLGLHHSRPRPISCASLPPLSFFGGATRRASRALPTWSLRTRSRMGSGSFWIGTPTSRPSRSMTSHAH